MIIYSLVSMLFVFFVDVFANNWCQSSSLITQLPTDTKHLESVRPSFLFSFVRQLWC